MPTELAIDDGLFVWPSEEPALRGSRCTNCAVVTFPMQSGCPRCYSEDMQEVALPTRGTLWSFTTQGFRPKSAPDGPYTGPDTTETFTPYAVGYVELPDHCKVEARLVGAEFDGYRIGMDMELAIVPFRTDEHGNDMMTFAFTPVR